MFNKENLAKVFRLSTGNKYPEKTYQLDPGNSVDDEVWVSDEIPRPYNKDVDGSPDNYRKTYGQKFLEKCKLIPCKEFFKTQNCSYTNSIKVTKPVLQEIWGDRKFEKNLIPTIENLGLGKFKTTNFVVCDMEKCMKGLGKGLILSPFADPIPPRMPILLYAGQLLLPVTYDEINKKPTKHNNPVYCYSVENQFLLSFQKSVCFDGISSSLWVIDACKEGGLARFVQHAPSADPKTGQILGIEDKDGIGSHALIANVEACLKIHNEIPYRYFQTKGWIYPGELLTVDYGNRYWKPKHFFCVFNSNLEVIGKVVYENNKCILQKSEGYDSKNDTDARRHIDFNEYIPNSFKAENRLKIRESLQIYFEHVLKVAMEVYPDEANTIETYIQKAKKVINLKTTSEKKCEKLKAIAAKFKNKKVFIKNKLLYTLDNYKKNCLSQSQKNVMKLDERLQIVTVLFRDKDYLGAIKTCNENLEMLNNYFIKEEYTVNDYLEARIIASRNSEIIANSLLELEEKNDEAVTQKFSALITELQSLIDETKTNPKLREILYQRMYCPLEKRMEKVQKKFDEYSSHLKHEGSSTLRCPPYLAPFKLGDIIITYPHVPPLKPAKISTLECFSDLEPLEQVESSTLKFQQSLFGVKRSSSKGLVGPSHGEDTELNPVGSFNLLGKNLSICL